MEKFSRQRFSWCTDEVRALNFFFIAALNLARIWVFFINLFIADKLVLYPPCIGPLRTFTSVLCWDGLATQASTEAFFD